MCPFEEYAQVFVEGEAVSAFVGCTRIRVDRDRAEDGVEGIVLEGTNGHAVITRSDEGHELFFRIGKVAPGEAVLTTEFNVNLLAPGSGESVVARARVVKAGRTLTVSLAEVFALEGGREKLVLLMTATNMAVRGRPGLTD